ncbi:Seizure 6-like protein [Anabarilius grahami]|uniref:Seizure 6-like protein n=1 Tax=Anabarilius grahami TaxID=495550 RepID=A0A3N0Z6W6_ANAGA|nr:Seizure 6-like protein [Anabarilius grahami]
MQVPVPKETPRGVASMGQDFLESVLSHKDHLLAQKGVTLPSGLPPNLVPMLGKGLGAGADALSPDQPFLRKMLPAHSGTGHPTLPPAYDLPTEPPEAVATPSWDTDAPTALTKPSVATAVPTTVNVETASGVLTSAVTNCRVNFTDPEGYIDSSDDPPLPEGAFLQCTYTVTVYTGYGVELQSNVPSSGRWCKCRDLITGVEHFGQAAVCSQTARAAQADVNERNGGLLQQCPCAARCNPVSMSALPLRIIHARDIISNYHFNPQPKACCVCVKSVNLSEGEQLSIRGVDEGGALLVLANQTLLVEGQVIRSPTNTLSVFYRSSPEGGVGMFQLHYQIFRLSCALPRRPHFGEVSVKDLHPGGTAHFQCHMGYHLQGDATLTCLNASLPVWSQREPSCRALCGGVVKNAMVGRVLSPSPHSGPNSTLDRSCSWSLEAPNGQRLHLHLERMVLGPTDRLVLWSGLDAGSVVLFDSGHGGPIPFEGVISEGPAVRVQFITDQPNSHNTGFNIRYEAFEKGHCYEPYIQNGNFSTTDPTYGVGTVVQFTCDPGHSLEQGPPVIECINTRDPYWNDTEPLCKALCGGDLSGPSGVILSPNWPEWYGEGEDCSWRIHAGEDKRVLLDVQLLNLSDSDMLTILDGDEVTTRILGQFVGGTSPFKMSSSTPDLTITFHSDPAGLVFGKGEGFIINYMEVSRNDSCPDLPEIQNGWKTTSHAALVRGARITYQCDPGYDLVGSETLTCQVDLSWNTQPPFCEKIMYCTDPGHVEHSTRTLSDPKLLVGTTIQYSCIPGYILQGGATLTCYGREPGTPVWTSRLPHCVSEESVSCENPGLPDNGYQILSKRLYLPGESLTFMCYQGYELIGEMAIKCILGNPSFWSGPLPLCRVAEAAEDSSFDGGSMALAIFILVLLVSVLLGGAYIYVTRCRYHSNLRLPLMYPHPYSQITVETEFDNPLYETGGRKGRSLAERERKGREGKGSVKQEVSVQRSFGLWFYIM